MGQQKPLSQLAIPNFTGKSAYLNPSYSGSVVARQRSVADNSASRVGAPQPLRDVARPWLGRQLCMSLCAVVAVAQEVGDYGRGHLGD